MKSSNSNIDPQARMVSGPVNVIRLEGNIHGIHKVIYLFMDYHIDVKNQTQCSNVFSEDVQKYFANNFYKLNSGNQIYDFFLEIYPSEVADNVYSKGIIKKEKKEQYIEEVVKLFRKMFRFDSRKNKVLVNQMFKNIRLHYLDIRDYYKNNIYSRVSEMSNLAQQFMENDNINTNALKQIIKLMEILKTHLELIVDILSTNSKNVTKTKIIKKGNNLSPDVQALEYLANKVKSAYKHSDVKKIMNKMLGETIDDFRKTIDDIDEATNDFNSYVRKIYSTRGRLVKDNNTAYLYNYGMSAFTVRKMIIDIVDRVEKLLDEKFVEFFARFTDIYFLRRFLDKDYITNAIVYSGALHSNTYVHVLVNHFDFKVTHFSYSKIPNATRLTSQIKKRSLMEIQELILPETFQQCSNMGSFPPEFL